MNINNNIEELVLKECIVSATGLSSDQIQIGLKGDPSLRETTAYRKRYTSQIDECYHLLKPNLEELLLNRSTYEIFLGFNNGEIRTSSIFDPFRTETHMASKMADHHYIERHFPEIEYTKKTAVIRNIYRSMDDSGVYDVLPDYWRNIIGRRNQKWQPMAAPAITAILDGLSLLRDIQEYYLRNITISIIQDFVRLQFNCDGTQLLESKNYQQFLSENFVIQQTL